MSIQKQRKKHNTNSEEKGTHESYPGRANGRPGLGANPIESVAGEEPLRNPPRHEAERGPEAEPFQAVTVSLGALAKDGGDGVLHNHGGEREEEDDGDNEGIQSGLGLGEREEPQQQALAREAAVQVRSAAAVAVAAAAVAHPRQLPIERPPVPVVVRVSLEGESAADRVESNVTTGVIDLRLRRRVARQSHRRTNLEKN